MIKTTSLVFFMVFLCASFGYADVLPEGGTSVGRSYRSKKWRSQRKPPLEVARLFWGEVASRDFVHLRSHVGFPFAWDSRCLFLRDFQALQRKIQHGPPTPPNLRFVGFTEIDLRKPPKNKYFLRALRRLYRPRTCRRSKAAKAQKLLMTYPEAFVSLYIVVGKKKVPTMTRLSMIENRWVVTGFDN